MNPATTETIVWLAFCCTYLGMASGRVPGLAVGRTGIALSAFAALLVGGALPPAQLGSVLELPTLLLLLALMLVAAHFELACGFEWIAERLNGLALSPRMLLVLVIVAGGLLSAVLVNDIVVFAFTPMLCRGVRRRGLDPRPFLLALAGAANAGSAATLIGNPQNILIGQVGGLDFARYSLIAVLPATVTLVIIYFVVGLLWRDALRTAHTVPDRRNTDFDAWLALKSLLATLVLVFLLETVNNRVAAALGVVAILLLGRRFSTRALLARVDGGLLLMIACLFAITATAIHTPQAQQAMHWLAAHHWLPYRLGSLALFSVVASNTIGNVPAVVLLLKAASNIPAGALYGLALFSTLSGNLLLTGSLANIIVAERSARENVALGFVDFARTGIPITAVSMGFSALWLWWLGII